LPARFILYFFNDTILIERSPILGGIAMVVLLKDFSKESEKIRQKLLAAGPHCSKCGIALEYGILYKTDGGQPLCLEHWEKEVAKIPEPEFADNPRLRGRLRGGH
jgi:hypothetical protein